MMETFLNFKFYCKKIYYLNIFDLKNYMEYIFIFYFFK